MRGAVYAINPQGSMVAIDAGDNGYTIIELLDGSEIEIGDEISWANDTGLGSETYKNVTRGERFEVFVQNHFVSEDSLREQLLME